ncbi:MAG: efflux RND transporter periplasmic adaptor subunit [Candidatus Aminicenantes bacterium]|nr:efflux RND transporter periplasmic adaptor subunit [Candidatus Aminicenantes bacterium]MDH5704433.1 efflux RND transporter periplasmic adaptor subunit [Candidatus Aminicenantes bacterium]
MKRKIIIGAVILVVITVTGIVLGLTVFNRNNGNNSKYKKEAVDRGNIEALVVTTGSLNPVTTVDVGSQVSGEIEKINVDFNSQVKEGQVIAQLEQSQFLSRVSQEEANYQSAVASLEKAKVTFNNLQKKYERALSLFEKDLLSYEEKESIETNYYGAKSDIQAAEARLAQANSQLETSKVNLTYTVIKSPIDGVVINRNINVGQTVAASFQAPVLFQIANDLTKMQVECSVDEADIGKVAEGQQVRFTVDAFPDENFRGVVKQVRYSPEIVQNVVTYTTIVEVDNPEMKLRPGMTATVSIVTGQALNALRVPNAALRFTPSLSQEEMRALFAKMKEERSSQRGGTSQEAQPGQKRDSSRQDAQRTESGQQQPGMKGQGMQGMQMRDFARLWIEDEKGSLKMVFIRKGVTDNSYTEVVRGDLQEGQLVITGENTQSSRSDRPSSSPMRMFR